MTDFILQNGLAIIFGLFALGALLSAIFNKKNSLALYVGSGFATLASLSGIVFSGVVLKTGIYPTFYAPSTFDILHASLKVDALSAFFILLISLSAFLVSIYSFGYAKHFFDKYNIGFLGFFYNTFIASMMLVVSAQNLLFFLVVWELMSLSSYFLVIYENKQLENTKAGWLYFIMTHIGTAFIVVSFLILYTQVHSLDFDVIKSASLSLSPTMLGLFLLTSFIGFGVKAGVMPLHVWLPSAHPSAPSHVSALMSGVMIKTAIYMFIRFYVDLLPNTPFWFGTLILVAGMVSSLLGVIYALSEHDIKRLLAYHSIENIGIILLGLGSGLMFFSLHMPLLAILALIASLYHTINHSIFKTLLFLSAGSVVSRIHTRNIEEYGGVIKYMPLTAFFFLFGSLAISGLPPLNGFFSEWATFQTLIGGVIATGSATKILFTLAIGALAFTSGFAAACFVKGFGAMFLARPRSEEVSNLKEVSKFELVGMAGMSTLIVIFGVFAGTIGNAIGKIVSSLGAFTNTFGANFVYVQNTASLSYAREGAASVSMPWIMGGLIIAFVFAFALTLILSSKQVVRKNLTWDCGSDLTPRMEITATSFSHSIIVVLRGILRPTKQTDVEYHDSSLRYFPKSRAVHFGVTDIYSEFLYQPMGKMFSLFSTQAKKIQTGNINVYILYIFVTLVGLLVTLTM